MPNNTDQRQVDNHANQMNPNNARYEGGSRSTSHLSQADHNNRANQLNPNNDTYRSSRGGK